MKTIKWWKSESFPHKKIPSVTIFFRGKSKQHKGSGGDPWSGQREEKKIRHKINSIQLAECSLLLADNISRWSLLRTERERVRFSRGVSNNGTLYPAPSAQPTSIHHHSYWKKTWGHLWRRILEGSSKFQSTEYASSTF